MSLTCLKEQCYELINFRGRRGGEAVRGSLGVGAPVIKLGLIVNTLCMTF